MPAPNSIAVAPAYHRHRPEQTALYAIVAEHYPRFVQEIECTDSHLPGFVRKEFEDYLKCGLLEHGFLRVKCDGCRHEHLVAFSCKHRGFCPSCGARRMVESAAHLVDHVFPEAPVRQFVLTFPFPLRFLLAAHPQVLSQVLAVVQRGIATYLIHRAGFTVASGARTGAVTLIQRFGSALNLNPHLGNCSCVALPPASLQSCTCCSWTGPIRFGAAVPYFIAPGARHAGRKALTLYTVPPVEDESAPGLVAAIAGFSLHAGTVCETWQRNRLERLCRYITRPPA